MQRPFRPRVFNKFSQFWQKETSFSRHTNGFILVSFYPLLQIFSEASAELRHDVATTAPADEDIDGVPIVSTRPIAPLSLLAQDAVSRKHEAELDQLRAVAD